MEIAFIYSLDRENGFETDVEKWAVSKKVSDIGGDNWKNARKDGWRDAEKKS